MNAYLDGPVLGKSFKGGFAGYVKRHGRYARSDVDSARGQARDVDDTASPRHIWQGRLHKEDGCAQIGIHHCRVALGGDGFRRRPVAQGRIVDY
jgi:hypothetical protein